MAGTVRNLARLSVGWPSNIFVRNNYLNFYRCLYSERSLGLQGYENARLNFRNQFLNVENTFRTKMQEVCSQESSMIFTEDLKSMLHLAQKKPEDIELLVKMITKFNNQNKEMRFGNYVFGPVVMRTFYYLDEPDLALTAFKDPQFEEFFDQLSSHQILLSLLYKHGKYTEMKDVYSIIKNKFTSEKGNPRTTLVLIMAACYKENTPEAFEYAFNIWKEMNQKGNEFMRRAIAFLAGLAIKQNAPHIAIEIISTMRTARFPDTRSLKVLAYTDLKRFTEIVPILRISLENYRTVGPKEVFFQDVIDKLEQSMAEENVPQDFELYKLINLLKQNDHIKSNQTLEEYIIAEIDVDPTRKTARALAMQSDMRGRSRQSFSSRDHSSDRRPMMQDFL